MVTPALSSRLWRRVWPWLAKWWPSWQARCPLVPLTRRAHPTVQLAEAPTCPALSPSSTCRPWERDRYDSSPATSTHSRKYQLPAFLQSLKGQYGTVCGSCKKGFFLRCSQWNAVPPLKQCGDWLERCLWSVFVLFVMNVHVEQSEWPTAPLSEVQVCCRLFLEFEYWVFSIVVVFG